LFFLTFFPLLFPAFFAIVAESGGEVGRLRSADRTPRSSEHRSHFGSRYKLGCCEFAGLPKTFAREGAENPNKKTPQGEKRTRKTQETKEKEKTRKND